MHRKYFIFVVILAIASALLAFIYMWKTAHTPKIQPQLFTTQPISPFKSSISGVGIVEASSKNISIGTAVNRVIDKVEVSVGQKVQEGQVLFCLDSRDLEADLLSKTIAYQNAVAKLEKLEALPRKEDVKYAEAVLSGSKIEFEQAKSLYEPIAGLSNSGALSQESINQKRFNMDLAKAKVEQSQASLDKTKVGAWLPDLEIARLEALQAKAQILRIEAEIERTIIKSPITGTILQVRINEGEYPPSDPTRGPAMILGNTEPLHLRVSINQFDASYFSPEASAVAFLQGNAKQKFPLKFVHIEPYFVTKQNLTNDITEKVDTRVLQVVYCFTENEKPIFVGQQMDVFIETTNN